MKNKSISTNITIFHDRQPPEEGLLAGYGALIEHYGLEAPLPAKLSIISRKHKHYERGEWRVFTPRHAPEETLAGQLTYTPEHG